MKDNVILTGARGFIGSNLRCNYALSRTIDLTDFKLTKYAFRVFSNAKGVIHCAAMHGSNEQMTTGHADYVSNNIVSDINVLNSSLEVGIKNVLCISSITAFPPTQKEYFSEEDLCTGDVHSDIFGYAWSKKATVSICKAFQYQHGVNYKSALLGNVYGPGAEFHDKAPIVGNLIYRIDRAIKENKNHIILYGDGKDVRSYLFVKDLDEIFKSILFSDIRESIIVSSEETISIRELAFLIAKKMNYKGEIKFSGDTKKNVQKTKVAKSNRFDIKKYNQTPLEKGIEETILYYNKEK